MDNKLAQRLRDAGFKGRWKPELEELMEACGEEFAGMFRVITKRDLEKWEHWQAENYGEDKNKIVGVGKTKRIAVAELFIKLNKRSIDKK